ncbi:MAG TPA: carbohydrate porin [Pyrinomonadaceae bacterium]|nr:carbohydrate porin [Pyrinomonadaceae bacterium]
MYSAARVFCIATAFLIILFVAHPNGQAQVPDPSPASTPTASPDSTQTAPTSSESQDPAAAKPAATPEPDGWHRETMTGDWGGTRSRWKEKGIELEFKLSNFVQGVTSGGVRHDTEFNGKMEMTWKFDLGKVAGWKYWSSEMKAEFRYSGPVLGGTGGLNPVNTATLTPAGDGEVVSITAINFTRLIPKDMAKGNLDVISFGRFNLLDLLQEDFFGGGGTDRFFNIAFIGPLTVLRQIPLVTNGFSYATVRGGEPRFTFMLLDPNDHSLNAGIDNLFADGVTFSPGYNIPTKYWGKSGKHTFGGAITTKKYTPFDAIRQVIIPGPPINPVEPKRGSWSASYTFRQSIVERGKSDGWGLFTQVAFADKDTSPMTRFFNVGLGGNGLFKKRDGDEFGIGYAYSNLSSVLKDNLNLVSLGRIRPRSDHTFEAFYDFHVTPWLQLTGDLQIIRGIRRDADTAIVPGARLVMIF